MPAIKDLVQPQCGQSNALVDLANKIFPPESCVKERSKLSLLKKDMENEFVSEFLASYNANTAAPSLFNMHSLLEQINTTKSTVARFSDESTVCISDWLKDFKNVAKELSQLDGKLEIDRTEEAYLDECWGIHSGKLPNETSEKTPHKWSVEYLLEAERNPSVAAPLGVTDPHEHEWRKEFEEFLSAASSGQLTEEDSFTSGLKHKVMQTELDEVWDACKSESNNWANEYVQNIERRLNGNDYRFKSDNPHADAARPLAAGKRALSKGDLANAILYFEAAVQKEPRNAQAWQFLGQAQAENEHEARTIAALHRCLELQPGNLDALILLSIAYTNEALYDSGCRSLLEWLKVNPKYAHFAKNVDSHAFVTDASSLNKPLFVQVESAFLRAVSERIDEVDPDLQNALGVLYNMSGELKKAVDCFRTALLVKPDDARLWNRLGATLANDQKSAEAICAYRKALELYPGFVRARYNLGVSCLNLGSHEQAIDHLISALTLQHNGMGPIGKMDMSQTIWSTLSVVVCRLSSPNTARLLGLIEARNFDAFKDLVFRSNEKLPTSNDV